MYGNEWINDYDNSLTREIFGVGALAFERNQV